MYFEKINGYKWIYLKIQLFCKYTHTMFFTCVTHNFQTVMSNFLIKNEKGHQHFLKSPTQI